MPKRIHYPHNMFVVMIGIVGVQLFRDEIAIRWWKVFTELLQPAVIAVVLIHFQEPKCLFGSHFFTVFPVPVILFWGHPT